MALIKYKCSETGFGHISVDGCPAQSIENANFKIPYSLFCIHPHTHTDTHSELRIGCADPEVGSQSTVS